MCHQGAQPQLAAHKHVHQPVPFCCQEADCAWLDHACGWEQHIQQLLLTRNRLVGHGTTRAPAHAACD